MVTVKPFGKLADGTEVVHYKNAVLVAEFDMNFYRTMGSSNSSISYDIVIKNNIGRRSLWRSLLVQKQRSLPW